MGVVESFESYIPNLIDNKGIHPAPMVVLLDEDRWELQALDLDFDQILQHFCTRIIDSEVAAAIVGIDRTTRPGQGTEFADVLTCILYERADSSILEVRVRDQFRYGVINYQHKPRIVRPIDWDNSFWNEQLRRELFQFIPSLVIGSSSG